MNTPSTWQIDHIGLAVNDLDRAIALYAQAAHTQVSLRETLTTQGVELAFLTTGGSKLELLAPLRPDTPLGRFIAKHGPGLHHICYRVDNIRTELLRLSHQGFTLIDSTPRPGAGGSEIAFISPKSFEGVLTELCEYPRP